jgi:hypothetical protein
MGTKYSDIIKQRRENGQSIYDDCNGCKYKKQSRRAKYIVENAKENNLSLEQSAKQIDNEFPIEEE